MDRVPFKPKVLKTEEDHKAALAYVELMMAQESPDEAELDLWGLLVETYEDEHFPLSPPTRRFRSNR